MNKIKKINFDLDEDEDNLDLDEDNLDLDEDKIKNLNLQKLRENNDYILSNFVILTEKTKQTFLKKLSYYKYVDELDTLQSGAYLRWIQITKTKKTIILAQGAIFCEVVLGEKGLMCVCKNFYNTYFQLELSTHLFFQKLSTQEIVVANILKILD